MYTPCKLTPCIPHVQYTNVHPMLYCTTEERYILTRAHTNPRVYPQMRACFRAAESKAQIDGYVYTGSTDMHG